MKNNEAGPAPLSPEDEIAVLLPFYLSGRLEADDRVKVERWLETSPNAQRALANANSEREAAVASNEKVPIPAGALGKLNAAIEQRGLQRMPKLTVSGLLEKVSRVFDFGDRRLAWAAAACLLLACIVQGSYLVNRAGESGYELAAGHEATTNAQPATATVIFAPSATMNDISEHLSAFGAHIVAGPRGRGAYDIAFDKDHPGGTKRERIEQFKRNKALVLVFKPR